MVPFYLVALKTPPGHTGLVFWNGLCSRTYASGCKIQTVLKENKKYSSCKGKGRNFGCIDMILIICIRSCDGKRKDRERNIIDRR